MERDQRREREQPDLVAEQQHAMKCSVDLHLYCDGGNFLFPLWITMNRNTVRLSTDSSFLTHSKEEVPNSNEFAA